MHVNNSRALEISAGDALRAALVNVIFPRENESKESKTLTARSLAAVLASQKIDYDKENVVYGVPFHFEKTREDVRVIVFTLTKADVLGVIPELNPGSIGETVDVTIPYVDTSEVDRTRQVDNPVPEEKKQIDA